MSVCIETDQQNNYSQYLPICEDKKVISFKQALQRLKLWMSRSRQRKQLALLDARMLADIGITPGQVRDEVNKPFWR